MSLFRRPWKQEQIVVLVFVVVEVSPFLWEAVKLREERIITILVTSQTFVALFLEVGVLWVNHNVRHDEEDADCGDEAEYAEGEVHPLREWLELVFEPKFE